MRYVLVDDSIPYDGYTSGRRPLGGAEKAVAGLATALQLRGHDVHVINKTTYAHMADGAYYAPFNDPMTPKTADVLIAMRKPALLGAIRNVKHRMLWVVGAPDYLNAPANMPLWNSFRPSLMFVSQAQARQYKGLLKSLVVTPGVRPEFFSTPPAYVAAAGVAADYFTEPAPEPIPELDPTPESEAVSAAAAASLILPEPAPAPPHAIVTTHPMHGLTWLLDMWQLEVHPRMPEARLAVYSASLSKGLRGEAVAENLTPILDQIREAAQQNVVVVDPLNDEGMGAVYRASRVHLYPGSSQDYACWTLAESQAAGLPAVARGFGGVEERVINGETGYLVPDTEAFANVTLEILKNDAVRKNLGDAAGAVTRRRTWAEAAAEVDAFCAALPKEA
ncbi:MAG: glycosyltransferase [Rhodospirillaceae bacterium]